MSKEEIKFDLNEDIFLQIAMMSYAKHNDKLCSINEHLGEIYSYKDLVDAEELQEHYEKHLGEIAIKQLQQENKQLKEDFAVLKILQMNTNNILNELEKYYKEQLEFIIELPAYTKDIAQEHKVMELCYEDFLNKIQELKEKYK